VMIGFFLFRFFDIFKPFPIRRFEKRLKGGWGVVLDDVLAGIYANIILQIISYYFTLSSGGPAR
jgi:phosphatidylglycerophosphatase A